MTEAERVRERAAVTPFGFGVERLLSMSRGKRFLMQALSCGAFVLALYMAGSPLWAALAFGNVVYTLDEILLVLASRIEPPQETPTHEL